MDELTCSVFVIERLAATLATLPDGVPDGVPEASRLLAFSPSPSSFVS